jgi:phage baseplate assembly protein V
LTLAAHARYTRSVPLVLEVAVPKVTDRLGRPVSGQMPGLVEAIVTDNKDEKNLGRVKVKFPTLPEELQSTWARLVTPMAGKKRGWVTLPEVDDEVLVAFVHGDVSHAIVVGALFNGEDTPPYTNDDGKNNLRVFQSRSGHRVTFDDTDGSERIELVTKGEKVRVVLDASAETLSVYADKDIILEAGDTISLKCQNLKVKASTKVSMKSDGQFEAKAGSSMTVEASAPLTLKGAIVNIN